MKFWWHSVGVRVSCLAQTNELSVTVNERTRHKRSITVPYIL